MTLRVNPVDAAIGAARTPSAAARIHALLRERIVAMQMLPGTALVEKEIAEIFGVSRTPVREALLRLADERLISIYAQRGTFVARIRLDAVRDAMLIRTALEAVAVREAARRAEPADADMLAAILERQTAHDHAGDLAAFHAEDEAFHEAVASIAGHPNLWRVIRGEKAQVDRCRVLTLPMQGRRGIVIAQHRTIAEHIASGDAEGAAAAMAEHLAEVLPSVDALTRSHPDYFEEADSPMPRRPPGRARAPAESAPDAAS
jgi:GntR family transcriptional regulator, rspAB operon transcriptional repressor